LLSVLPSLPSIYTKKTSRNIISVPPEQLENFDFDLVDYVDVARAALDADPLLDKLR
jgi:hypothetical protein